jgi:hypothetical protein
VTRGKLTAITQYIPTIYSPSLVSRTPILRLAIIQYFREKLEEPLSTLYDRYAVDLALLNPEDETGRKFTVIEVNPFFELTGEGLFESEEGRKILNGEKDHVEYPVMRVQQMRVADPTEKHLLVARREVEKELGITSLEGSRSLI